MYRKPNPWIVFWVAATFLLCRIHHWAEIGAFPRTKLYALDLSSRRTLEVPLEEFEPSPDVMMAKGGWPTASDHEVKYFKEFRRHPHVLQGFGPPTLVHSLKNRDLRIIVLRQAFSSFHAFATSHGFTYWLAAGSLLGQVQGEAIMPFDVDVDLQTPLRSLEAALAHNRTLWDERYWLDINPHYRQRWSLNIRQRDGPEPNKIDARWVDTKTGIYIDINALAVDWAAERVPGTVESRNGSSLLQDKSIWTYDYKEISPLRPCRFEGVTTWCPAQKGVILQRQFKNGVAYGPHYRAWHLNATTGFWNKLSCDQLVQMYAHPTHADCDQYCRKIVGFERQMKWGPERRDDDREHCCALVLEWEEKGRHQIATFWGVLQQGNLPHLDQSVYHPVIL